MAISLGLLKTKQTSSLFVQEVTGLSNHEDVRFELTHGPVSLLQITAIVDVHRKRSHKAIIM